MAVNVGAAEKQKSFGFTPERNNSLHVTPIAKTIPLRQFNYQIEQKPDSPFERFAPTGFA
jgi:hypothetical protein